MNISAGDPPALSVAEEGHDEHVLADLERLWATDARGHETLEVAHLLLSP
jgi:hypothetical protein